MSFLHRLCLRPSRKEKLKDDTDRRDDKSFSSSSSTAKPEEEASSGSGKAVVQDSDYKFHKPAEAASSSSGKAVVQDSDYKCHKPAEAASSSSGKAVVQDSDYKCHKPAEAASSSSGKAVVQDSDYKCRVFSYRELATATNNFSCFLGKGGFGSVYKGKLDDGKEVAVKVHNKQIYGQGNEEFLVEVLWLSILNHENLVHLFGYCADPKHRLLVYKYMPLGSLDKHIHGKEVIDWITRMKIALGTAKGLKYLHHEAEANQSVIYRDMKTSNILLDNEYNPKLSDFGLARFGPTGNKSYVKTEPAGTLGYCAPEYITTKDGRLTTKYGRLTLKCDIYSYGVVLLELLTGRKALMDVVVTGQSRLLVDFARLSCAEIMRDVLRRGDVSETVAKRTLQLAMRCVQKEAENRPMISEVVEELEDIVATSSEEKMQRSNGFGGDMDKATTTTKTLAVIIEEEKEEERKALERKREVAKAFSWAEKARKGKQKQLSINDNSS